MTNCRQIWSLFIKKYQELPESNITRNDQETKWSSLGENDQKQPKPNVIRRTESKLNQTWPENIKINSTESHLIKITQNWSNSSRMTKSDKIWSKWTKEETWKEYNQKLPMQK